MPVKMRLHKGDRVRVLRGKDRGATGDIIRVIPKDGRIIVEGVNRAKKHQKATRATMQGGIIDKDMPISASAVALVCNHCGKATLIGYEFDQNGEKKRICKKCKGAV